MIRDLRDKIKNYFNKKLNASQIKALEAAYSRHVKTVLESSHRTEPKNPHLYNKELHDKLKEMDKAMNQISDYSINDDGTPILTEERREEIAQKYIKEYKEAKNRDTVEGKKDLRNKFDAIDNEMHEGIDKPTEEEKFEITQSPLPEDEKPKPEDEKPKDEETTASIEEDMKKAGKLMPEPDPPHGQKTFIWVPGKGKGKINVDKPKKVDGMWQVDWAKLTQAKDEADAWIKENGGEVKEPKPKDKPSPSIGDRRGTGAQSALESFTEGAGSKLDALRSFVDNYRGKKD